MKKLLYISVFALLLFSCKGNGQITEAEAKKNNPNLETKLPNTDNNLIFSGDYNDLLTLELASRITGFEPSKAKKMNTMKGMQGEILRYYWDNGRVREKEKTTPIRKNTKIPSMDLVQIKWVDDEADMESFLDFIEPEEHPELSKISGVGESAYWNSKKNQLEVYHKGVSFTLEVDTSNNNTINKEKTIALAKLIITEKL